MRSFDAGKFNSLLTINDGILSLKYSGGEVCRHNNRSRSSIINFACASTGGSNQPQFITEDDDCTYFFSWHTSLACRNEVSVSLCSICISMFYLYLYVLFLSLCSISISVFYFYLCSIFISSLSISMLYLSNLTRYTATSLQHGHL